MKAVSERELYWIVKNGIKMTRMPGFGPTHDEEKLWTIVAFVKRMPDLQAKEYEAMAREAEGAKGKKEHHHDSKKH
jgi:mono/diheme cytochrome c family protein